MAEVPDYLVPHEGYTNSHIRFAGLDAFEDRGGAHVRFDIRDEDDFLIGTFEFDVSPQTEGTIDAVVAEAHRHMRDVVRQWLHQIDMMHQAYEKSAGRQNE